MCVLFAGILFIWFSAPIECLCYHPVHMSVHIRDVIVCVSVNCMHQIVTWLLSGVYIYYDMLFSEEICMHRMLLLGRVFEACIYEDLMITRARRGTNNAWAKYFRRTTSLIDRA